MRSGARLFASLSATASSLPLLLLLLLLLLYLPSPEPHPACRTRHRGEAGHCGRVSVATELLLSPVRMVSALSARRRTRCGLPGTGRSCPFRPLGPCPSAASPAVAAGCDSRRLARVCVFVACLWLVVVAVVVFRVSVQIELAAKERVAVG